MGVTLFFFCKVNFSLKFRKDPISAHVYNSFQSATSCFDLSWDCTLQGSVGCIAYNNANKDFSVCFVNEILYIDRPYKKFALPYTG